MVMTLGIRREDKNKWERRAPIIPSHVKELKEKFNIETIVQPSDIRIFLNKSYKEAGAILDENLSKSSVIFAIKEIPIDFFEKGKTYIFFSHTIKGQKHNMPILKKMMKLGCNLIDYEKISDSKGRRLVFFGRYAGTAGMIDTLWAYGQRMKYYEIDNPFSELRQTIDYNNLNDAKNHLKKICNNIKQKGFSKEISPLVVGFTGYGNVSKGAQEILDILPVKEIRPKQLEAVYKNFSNKVIYKVVFKEEDIVEPISAEKQFNLQEYYNQPHLFRSCFHQFVPNLSILLNCIFWDIKYPRLITKECIKEKYDKKFKLQVIGDISVDLNGSIEFTEKVTTPDNPIYLYDPIRDNIIDGYMGSGIVVMAIDNLPCEIPLESSEFFSDSIYKFIPSIMKADFSVDFNKLNLPVEIKKAVILYQGKLTKDYQYINKYL